MTNGAFTRLRSSKNAHALVAALVSCGDNGKRLRVVSGDETIVLVVTRESNIKTTDEP